MNKKQILFKIYRLLQKIKYQDRVGNKEGYVKIYPQNTIEHEFTKFQICHKLKRESFKVYTECTFADNSGRADIMAIAPNGDGHIIEIETPKSKKEYKIKVLSKEDYPKDLTLTIVNTKDFKISEFKL